MPTRFLPLLALCLLVPAAAAQSPGVAVVPYAGYDYARKTRVLGLGARLALPLPGRFSVEPAVDLQFPDDDGRRLQAGLHLIAEVPIGPVAPYVGGGVTYVNQAAGGTRTGGFSAPGGTVFAGASLKCAKGIRPFAQVRYSATDILEESAVAWTGGVVIGR